MKREQFQSFESGSLTQISEGSFAFVPNYLPPKIVYDDNLVALLSRADKALGELSGTGRLLPNPHILVAPYLRQEAVYSSRIEGTQTDIAEYLQDELHAPSPRSDRGIARQEVGNYLAAIQLGIDLSRELPFSLRLIRDVHERLMTGVRGGEQSPGQFRRIQNYIVRPGDSIKSAVFVPPPVPQMMDALNQWEKFANQEELEMPDLIRCALLHYQFETIHPFLDGNGRVGRLIIPIYLMMRGSLSQPLLYLSAYFASHRPDYYETLQRVRTHGEWIAWIRFFLTGVVDTAQSALNQAKRLTEIREDFISHAKIMPRALTLVDALFENPYITYSYAHAILGVSLPTARKTVQFLVDNGLLKNISDREWNPLFVARPILDAIQNA